MKDGKITNLGFISATDLTDSCSSDRLKTVEQENVENEQEVEENSGIALMITEVIRKDSLTRDILIISISLCLVCCIGFTVIQCIKYCCRSQAQVKPKDQALSDETEIAGIKWKDFKEAAMVNDYTNKKWY